jgi:HlyD family secretion protein
MPAVLGRAIVAEGQLGSLYPSLPLGFGGGVSGEVLTITVKAGDTVRAGETLALLDDTDLQCSADEAQRAVDRARADHEQALRQWERDVADAESGLADARRALSTARLGYSETAVEEARTALDRARTAEEDAKGTYEWARGFWPPLPVDDYYDGWQRAIRERELAEMRLVDAEDAHSAEYLDLEARAEDVAQAERALAALQEGVPPVHQRAVEDAEGALARSLDALEHARLAAPWAAIVLSVDAAPGATAGTGTPVVTLLDVQDGLRFVSRNLSEQHVANVYPGQRAIVTLRTFAETPLEGTVEAVVPQVGEAASVDARFTVYVRLSPGNPEDDLRLLPGLTGRVEIFAGDR